MVRTDTSPRYTSWPKKVKRKNFEKKLEKLFCEKKSQIVIEKQNIE